MNSHPAKVGSPTRKGVRTAMAKNHGARQQKKVAKQKAKRAELPPRLRFLESLSNEAFKKFFDKYN